MTVTCCDGVRMGVPCRCLFAVGLLSCPHCGSREFHEFGSRPEDEEHPMAKITVLTGPTDATVPARDPSVDEDPPEETEGDDEAVAEAGEDPDDLVAEAEDGGDGPDVAAEPPALDDEVVEVPEVDGDPVEPVVEENAPTNAEIRDWAAANQVEVSASGPISKAVREAYDAAHAAV